MGGLDKTNNEEALLAGSTFKALARKYRPLLWSVAHRAQASDPEDAVQEMLISLWRSRKRYDPRLGSEAGFVAMIAKRRMIDHVRTAPAATEPLPDGLVSRAHEALESAAELRLALRALNRLRPERRQVLEMSLFEGLTHAQIAGRLRLPLGTVKSHHRRGLQTVQRALRPVATV